MIMRGQDVCRGTYFTIRHTVSDLGLASRNGNRSWVRAAALKEPHDAGHGSLTSLLKETIPVTQEATSFIAW